MDLVNDLGNDLVQAMLVQKKHSKKIDSKEILPLISKIKEVLEPISLKDHLYSNATFTPKVIDVANSH